MNSSLAAALVLGTLVFSRVVSGGAEHAAEIQLSAVPAGLIPRGPAHPALKRWAILVGPSGTLVPARAVGSGAKSFFADSSTNSSNSPNPSANLFQIDRLLEISISIAPSDWEKLCGEHHDLLAALGPTRLVQPEPNPYKTYRADVTVDGQRMQGVGVRKRGFLGSASFQRPALGIRFDEFDPKKEFHGLKRLSLNNNLQDPSQLHQVLAYRVFNQAGVPAPRCNLARVCVNGACLGIYSHVEAIDKPFLNNHFGSASGNLYEGQVSDFRPDWVKTFEKKNHKQDNDRGDLEAVVKALQSDDARLLARLEPLVDLDAYLTYWAVETLIGHWDSYSANANNFFVYRHPADQKFHFIPWGADSVFGDRNPFARFARPESVQARSILPYRLYQLPSIRERYRQRLRELLATVWNEQELLDEVLLLEALLKPQMTASESRFQGGVKKVRHFINSRRAALKAELTNTAPAWDIPLKESPCLQKGGTLNLGFETTWEHKRPANPLKKGTANLIMDWHGARQVFGALGVIAGPAEDPRHTGFPSINLIGSQGGKMTLLAFIVQPKNFKAGSSPPLDGFEVASVLLEGNLLGLDFRFSALPIGTFRLLHAGTKPGDKVVGKIQADLYRIAE